MPKIRSIEFWLFALPVVAIAVWAAGIEQEIIRQYLIPVLLVTWMVLAIAWMLREVFRRICD